MSGETLRRAAALMRERAEHASPSPWHAERNQVWDRDDDSVVRSQMLPPDADVWHIASWHPTVALAVADLLDEIALRWEYVEERELALAVARAYLGETP